MSLYLRISLGSGVGVWAAYDIWHVVEGTSTPFLQIFRDIIKLGKVRFQNFPVSGFFNDQEQSPEKKTSQKSLSLGSLQKNLNKYWCNLFLKKLHLLLYVEASPQTLKVSAPIKQLALMETKLKGSFLLRGVIINKLETFGHCKTLRQK